MLELFRRLGVKLATSESPPPCTFSVGSDTFVFPEGICPYCKESIRSNYIWQLRNAYLKNWWKISDGKIVNRPLPDYSGRVHPHVNGGLHICLGDSRKKTPEVAMFLGWSPYGSYEGNPYWFMWLERVWDHQCPKKNKVLRDLGDY